MDNNEYGVRRFCASFNRQKWIGKRRCSDIWIVHDGKTFESIAEGTESKMKKLAELLTKYGVGEMKGKMF